MTSRTPILELDEFGTAGVPSGEALTRTMRRLDAITQLAVLGFATAPPSSPELADRYIVADPATGLFAGHELHVAFYSQDGWQFFVPRTGWIALVNAQPYMFVESLGAWTLMALLPAGGSSGDVLTKTSSTDYAASWSAAAGAGSDPASSFQFFTDCEYGMFGATAGGGSFNVSQSGSGSGTFFEAIDGHPGVISPNTGTTSGGRAGATVSFSGTAETTWLILGSDSLEFDALISVPTLPDGTQTFEFAIGFLGKANNASTSGLVAKVVWNGSAVRWRLTGISGGVSTNSDAATGPTADTWHHVQISATTTGAELFVDGVSVATLSSGLPTAGFSIGYHIAKSAGTTARSARIDFMRARQTFSTARF